MRWLDCSATPVNQPTVTFTCNRCSKAFLKRVNPENLDKVTFKFVCSCGKSFVEGKNDELRH